MFNEEKIIAKWAADMYDANETDTADVDFALSIVGDAPKGFWKSRAEAGASLCRWQRRGMMPRVWI